MSFLQKRAQGLPSHTLSMSISSLHRFERLTNVAVSQLPGFNAPDVWAQRLAHAFREPADLKRSAVERVLFLFVNGNRCLFPELAQVNIKRN